MQETKIRYAIFNSFDEALKQLKLEDAEPKKNYSAAKLTLLTELADRPFIATGEKKYADYVNAWLSLPSPQDVPVDKIDAFIFNRLINKTTGYTKDDFYKTKFSQISYVIQDTDKITIADTNLSQYILQTSNKNTLFYYDHCSKNTNEFTIKSEYYELLTKVFQKDQASLSDIDISILNVMTGNNISREGLYDYYFGNGAMPQLKCSYFDDGGKLCALSFVYHPRNVDLWTFAHIRNPASTESTVSIIGHDDMLPDIKDSLQYPISSEITTIVNSEAISNLILSLVPDNTDRYKLQKAEHLSEKISKNPGKEIHILANNEIKLTEITDEINTIKKQKLRFELLKKRYDEKLDKDKLSDSLEEKNSESAKQHILETDNKEVKLKNEIGRYSVILKYLNELTVPIKKAQKWQRIRNIFGTVSTGLLAIGLILILTGVLAPVGLLLAAGSALFYLAITGTVLSGLLCLGGIFKTRRNERDAQNHPLILLEKSLLDIGNQYKEEENELDMENKQKNKNALNLLNEKNDYEKIDPDTFQNICNTLDLNIKSSACGFYIEENDIKDIENYIKQLKKLNQSAYYYFSYSSKDSARLYYYNHKTNDIEEIKPQNEEWNSNFLNTLYSESNKKQDIKELTPEQLDTITRVTGHIHCGTLLKAFDEQYAKVVLSNNTAVSSQLKNENNHKPSEGSPSQQGIFSETSGTNPGINRNHKPHQYMQPHFKPVT